MKVNNHTLGEGIDLLPNLLIEDRNECAIEERESGPEIVLLLVTKMCPISMLRVFKKLQNNKHV